MERLYDRQQNPTPNNKYDVLVLGVGGIGSWTAINLAMSGMCRSLWLMDGDEIERSNLNRLPWTDDDIGKKKTTVVQEWINDRRDIPVADIDEFLTDDNKDDVREIQETLDAVLFCADGSEARELATDAFPELYDLNKLLFFGAEGNEISFYTTHESWDFNEDAGYDDIWVGNAMQAGVAAVNLFRTRMDFEENNVNREVPRRFTYDIDPIERYDAEMERSRADQLEDHVDDLIDQTEELEEQLSQAEQQNRTLKDKYEKARRSMAGLLHQMRDIIADNRDIQEASYNDVLERSR